MARYAGAAALFAVGADHLAEYLFAHYSAIPTIGTLFVLNFASATLVALALVAPVEWLDRPAGRAARDALALAGIGIAAGSLMGLLVSERTSLFGFSESGYRSGIVLAIALDAATILLLSAFIARPDAVRASARRAPRWRRHRARSRPSM
jgi:hypothetical protein